MQIRILVFCILLFGAISEKSLAQKPRIDTSVLSNWPSIYTAQLSPDGKYASYVYSLHDGLEQSVIIKGTSSEWTLLIGDATSVVFSEDSRLAFVKYLNNKLEIVRLGTGSIRVIEDVIWFHVFSKRDIELFIYTIKGNSKEVYVLNINTGNAKKYSDITKCVASSECNALVVEKIPSGETSHELDWISLPDQNIKKIYKGNAVRSIAFENKKKGIGFLTNETGENKTYKSLWYFSLGMDMAEKLVTPAITVGFDKFDLGETLAFTSDGDKILCTLEESNSSEQASGTQVDVWSYNDGKLQDQQLAEQKTGRTHTYKSVVDINSRRLTRLEFENEISSNIKGDHLLIGHLEKDADVSEEYWNPDAKRSILLRSVDNGETIRLPMSGSVNWFYCFLSPDGNYVVYYSPKDSNYFSYCIKTQEIKNLTVGINTKWTDKNEYIHQTPFVTCGIAGWIRGDSGVLIYDQTDIWLLDLAGDTSPKCITKGFGLRNQIVLRVSLSTDSGFKQNDEIIVNAFNEKSKQTGFFKVKLGEDKEPHLLMMGNYVCNSSVYHGAPLIKAKYAEAYIITRMSTGESKNFYFTQNFNAFKQISNNRPEREINWLRVKLLRWKTFDGEEVEGLLYEPEDFDPTKKYPMIVECYERFSERLNLFPEPELSNGPINIPWFTSQGYLVFCPDIKYTRRGPGVSGFNSVVSGVKSLCKYAWIDSSHIGIQGHSFGAYETNYIITHSTIFAAAMSAEGVSDVISEYGSRGIDHKNNQTYYEYGQGRMVLNPWQDTTLFIANSPILAAGAVTTPLLLMSNKEDEWVGFSQGLELFLALRRLGKKVWLLQYDGERHILVQSGDRLDFTIRVNQFFDHYLKQKGTPKWMDEGVPARKKGVDPGYEISTNNNK